MMLDAWATTKISDLTKEKSAGETINVHVVSFAKEPLPDFEEMQRVVSGKEDPIAPPGSKRDATR